MSQLAAFQIMLALHRWMSIQSATFTESQGNSTATGALQVASNEACISPKSRTVYLRLAQHPVSTACMHSVNPKWLHVANMLTILLQ